MRVLRLVVLTSLRDVARCDKNGQMVETKEGPRYMMGALEALIRATSPGGNLHGLIEVVGVITDDFPKDLDGYPAVPTTGKPWIHPLDLRGPDGRLIAELTVNIPSSFRSLPKSDEKGRMVAKERFERQVVEFMQGREADVLLSDHYMARIDWLWRWMPGMVLNIHPAVTLPGHQFSFCGKTPTQDAIDRANREDGVRTGATLHFVDAEIDHGNPILWSQATPVYATDQPQELRHRNYQTAKLPVLIDGLSHYARSLYTRT